MSSNLIVHPGARSTDPITSHESAETSGELRGKIANAILDFALQAGSKGVTINEATAALPQFKAVSISPIFKPLVKAEKLVRKVIGRTDPSERWPKGKEVYETRVDPSTNKKCIVHFHHAVVAKKPTSTGPGGAGQASTVVI